MTLPPFVLLGLRSLWRDLRAGDLRLLIVAVTLAVAALSAVGFFADRLKNGLQRDAAQLLGGDVVIASDEATPAAFKERARALGLQQSAQLSFPTMARASEAEGGATRLVTLRAVSAGYPLRGQLMVAMNAGAPGEAANGIPAPGTAWVEASVLDALNLKLGDQLLLGDAALTLARVLVSEPDRGTGFMNFSPHVMLNQADVAATGLIQPASRVSYRLALAAPTGASGDTALRQFVQEAEAQVKAGSVRGVRVETLDSGRPDMRLTLDRANQFLNLVALLSALLSAVAVALASRSFANRHLDACAMLRVLGQSQRRIAASYALEFVLIGLLASLLGLLLGYALHYAFVWLLAGLVRASLPAPGMWPLVFGLGVGLTLLMAFGLPPVLQLAQVPALRVIRRDLGALKPTLALVMGLGVAGFAALLLAVSADLKLGLIAVGGFAAAVLLFALLSWLALGLLRRSVREDQAPPWMVLATRQVTARLPYAVVQTTALAVGMLALVLLVLLRTDLISSWRNTLPPDAPNRFVINILPEQADAFQQRLRDGGVAQYDWYPMFRGRLVAVNGRAVSVNDYQDERARHMVDREFNLSYSAKLPARNQVVGGQWQEGEAGAISMEADIAKTLGLHLGDQLRFDIGGMTSEARISSLRKVDWGSMHANFYALYPVAQLADVPATFITAFRAPAQPGLDNRLVHEFPNITAVDMSSTLGELQRVLDQVIQAVEFLFGFALLAGLVVLVAAVGATREDRVREFAIMRALGAQTRLLRQVQRAELVGVGLLAGAMATCAGLVVGWALAHYVFEFSWTAPWWAPVAGAVCGAVLALVAGWWSLREVLLRPVVATLRAAQ